MVEKSHFGTTTSLEMLLESVIKTLKLNLDVIGFYRKNFMRRARYFDRRERQFGKDWVSRDLHYT